MSRVWWSQSHNQQVPGCPESSCQGAPRSQVASVHMDGGLQAPLELPSVSEGCHCLLHLAVLGPATEDADFLRLLRPSCLLPLLRQHLSHLAPSETQQQTQHMRDRDSGKLLSARVSITTAARATTGTAVPQSLPRASNRQICRHTHRAAFCSCLPLPPSSERLQGVSSTRPHKRGPRAGATAHTTLYGTF